MLKQTRKVPRVQAPVAAPTGAASGRDAEGVGSPAWPERADAEDFVTTQECRVVRPAPSSGLDDERTDDGPTLPGRFAPQIACALSAPSEVEIHCAIAVGQSTAVMTAAEDHRCTASWPKAKRWPTGVPRFAGAAIVDTLVLGEPHPVTPAPEEMSFAKTPCSERPLDPASAPEAGIESGVDPAASQHGPAARGPAPISIAPTSVEIASQRPPKPMGGALFAASAMGAALGVAALAAAWIVAEPRTTSPASVDVEIAQSTDGPFNASEVDASEAARENAAHEGVGVDGASAALAPSDALSSEEGCAQLSDGLCGWLREQAAGRVSDREPSYAELQAFFLEHGIQRARGRVLGDAVSPNAMQLPRGTYQATSNGTFGYCLKPATPIEGGSFYTKWVRRSDGAQPAIDASGRATECVVYEEVALPETLTALKQAQDLDAKRALAEAALRQVGPFFEGR